MAFSNRKSSVPTSSSSSSSSCSTSPPISSPVEDKKAPAAAPPPVAPRAAMTAADEAKEDAARAHQFQAQQMALEKAYHELNSLNCFCLFATSTSQTQEASNYRQHSRTVMANTLKPLGSAAVFTLLVLCCKSESFSSDGLRSFAALLSLIVIIPTVFMYRSSARERRADQRQIQQKRQAFYQISYGDSLTYLKEHTPKSDSIVINRKQKKALGQRFKQSLRRFNDALSQYSELKQRIPTATLYLEPAMLIQPLHEAMLESLFHELYQEHRSHTGFGLFRPNQELARSLQKKLLAYLGDNIPEADEEKAAARKHGHRS